MIALIDYGAGNLTSVRKAFAAVGAEFTAPRTPAELARVDGIVVPGVGHFGATASLDGSWRDAIRARIEDGCPLFGICLGMQWLFEESTEAPGVPGLGLLAGRCARIDDRHGALKVPHVGWNSLELPRRSRLLEGVAPGAYVYFTHSYAAPVTAATAATTTYGSTFAAAVEQDHVCGVQFHPEKSSDAGLQMIRNFVARCRRQPVAGAR
jgi:imidazole glycerol-phosphate synthase subunit HisH